MKRILLLSDTHGFLDESVFIHAEHCDEIWHAGDFGTIEIADRLINFGKENNKNIVVRGVYGNSEDVKIYMKHIGGYPGKYAPGVKQEIRDNQAKLFISGHSHILKVIYDDKIDCLHMNPGAAGKQGWHKVRTLLRFNIDGADIKNCEVIELGAR